MRQDYASKLTKQMLLDSGVTEITENGRVFKNGRWLRESKLDKLNKYYKFSITVLDEDNNKVQKPVCIHRAMYAWFYNEVPAGMIVDHIDNDKYNNNIDNLQLLTPEENNAKDRKKSVYMPYMSKKKVYTLEYINKMIDHHTARLEEAKKAHDADKCHKLRSSVAQWKRRKEILFNED